MALNSLLAEWGNRGLNFWTVSNTTLTLNAGVATYDLPSDTIDVMDLAIRTNPNDANAVLKVLGCELEGGQTRIT